MNPYADLLNQQRKLSPPPCVVYELEQTVMARIERLPQERRRKQVAIAAATLGCALILLVVSVAIRPNVQHSKPPDFVESVVILDDHICIWLENAATTPQNELSHP